jgi:hypothetical protein
MGHRKRASRQSTKAARANISRALTRGKWFVNRRRIGLNWNAMARRANLRGINPKVTPTTITVQVLALIDIVKDPLMISIETHGCISEERNLQVELTESTNETNESH